MPPEHVLEQVRFDADGRPFNWRGQQVPHQLNPLTFARAIPGLLEQFQKIPNEFWSLDAEDDVKLAVVACPCGCEPVVPTVRLVECECHRFFLFTGSDVLAANRPGQYGEQPVDPALGAEVPTSAPS